MAPRYEVNVEFLSEVGHHILVEHIADAPLTFLVLGYLCLWICPEQVAEETLVRNVSRPLNHLNVAVVRQLLAQTAVHTQNFIIYQSCNWQLLKYANKLLEQPTVFLIVSL